MSFKLGIPSVQSSDSRLERQQSRVGGRESDSGLQTQDFRLASASTLETGRSRLTSRLDFVMGVGTVGAVVFAALAFGSVEAWAMALLESIAVVLTGLWIIKWIIEGQIRVTIPLVLVPVAGLVCWGLIQAIVFTNVTGERKSITMDVESSRIAVTSIFFVLVLALVAANYFADRQRLRRLGTFLVFYGFALAVFALIQSFTWDGAFYWFRPTRSLNGFGPFANRDHFAGYMEMLAPFPAALILTRAIPAEQRMVYGFAGVVIVVAVLASLSRGGMLSLVVEGIFIAFWVARSHARGAIRASSRMQFAIRTALLFGAFAAVAALGIIWLGPDRILNRATSTISDLREEQAGYISRQWIWRDTWSLIKSHPITGTGIGSFETVFTQYSHNNGRLIIAQAHNDYLQVLADCGVVGAVLAIWFLTALFVAMRPALKSQDRLLSGIALACSASIVGMLAHSLFDFNLQIPSNALLFLLLVATLSNVPAAVGESISIKAYRLDHQTTIAAITGVQL